MFVALALSALVAASGSPIRADSPATETTGRPAPRAAVPHAIAFVNDPRSHGQVGDQWLSLNEVIQLHNRTLAFHQLSPQEQMQVSGGAQDVAWADIDASATPVITIERDLDVILDFPHGLLIGGVNGMPVLDFTGATTGFVTVSNNLGFHRLSIRGGAVGVELTQTDSLYGCVIDEVEFVSQTTAGVRCTMASAGHNGRLLLQRCRFNSLPVGVLVDETGADRRTVLYLGDSAMTAVQTGLEVRLGMGGSGTYLLERLDLDTLGYGVRFLRPGGATRAVTMESSLVRIAGAAPFDYQGAPGVPSALTLRMLELHGTGPGAACRVGPLGGQVTGEIDELTAVGGLTLLTGGTGQLLLANARVRNGPVQLGTGGTAALRVLDSRFDNTAITSAGGMPVTMVDCCFVGGSLVGTATAPLQIAGSYLGASLGTHVASTAPLPQAQLGSSSLAPPRPVLGGPVSLRADLPAGFLGVWALGPTAAFPTILARPLHLYLDLSAAVTAPGVYRLQQSLDFTVPNNPALLATDWVAQMLVLPDPGVPGPVLSLPPGVRFVVR